MYVYVCNNKSLYTHKSYRLIAAGRVVRVVEYLVEILVRGAESVRREQVLVLLRVLLKRTTHIRQHFIIQY